MPPAEGDSLKQQAALYTFQLTNGRIAVAREDAKPEDQEATEDFLEELRRKVAELRDRINRAQADVRLRRTLALLDERLAPPIDTIRIGLVLSSLRSLESDYSAYSSDEGRKEHASDLIAALDDLAGTIRDFASQFPRAREIVANQMALELTEEPRALELAVKASEELAIVADRHRELIEPEAPEALREPREVIRGCKDSRRSSKTGRAAPSHAGQLRPHRRAGAGDGRRLCGAKRGSRFRGRQGRLPRVQCLEARALLFAHWVGHDGLSMVLATALAIRQINDAVGKRGGVFDRLLKTIERIAELKVPGEFAARRKTAKKKKTKTNK